MVGSDTKIDKMFWLLQLALFICMVDFHSGCTCIYACDQCLALLYIDTCINLLWPDDTV